MQTTLEETPIGGLQTPKVAIIAETGGRRGNHLTSTSTSTPTPAAAACTVHSLARFRFYHSATRVPELFSVRLLCRERGRASEECCCCVSVVGKKRSWWRGQRECRWKEERGRRIPSFLSVWCWALPPSVAFLLPVRGFGLLFSRGSMDGRGPSFTTTQGRYVNGGELHFTWLRFRGREGM